MTNIIMDPAFEYGAQIFAAGKPMTFTGVLVFKKELPKGSLPPWLLTQWNSRGDIQTIQPAVTETGVTYSNEYKTVAWDNNGTLTLRVNGSAEYIKPREKLADRWVHLYFEQKYSAPYPVGNADNVNLNFSYAVTHFEDCTPKGKLDESIHACIAVFYIILKDINLKSPAYNQYINFCVMLFDNRTAFTKESWHMDAGQNPLDATNMIVYTMNSSVYAGPVIADGTFHDVDVNLVPYFKRAFEIAQKNNCLKGSEYRNLAVSSIDLFQNSEIWAY